MTIQYQKDDLHELAYQHISAMDFTVFELYSIFDVFTTPEDLAWLAQSSFKEIYEHWKDELRSYSI